MDEGTGKEDSSGVMDCSNKPEQTEAGWAQSKEERAPPNSLNRRVRPWQEGARRLGTETSTPEAEEG